jgi:predicted acylesterase/phospholipase RssA
MEDLFLNHPATNFWSFWPYYVIEPFYKKSFVDFSKFTTFLHEKMKGRPWVRKVSIQSVDLITGKVVIFDENLSPEIREKAVISSASIPFVFPPIEIDGM